MPKLWTTGFGGILTTLLRTHALSRHDKLGIHSLLKLRTDCLLRRGGGEDGTYSSGSAILERLSLPSCNADEAMLDACAD